MFGFNDRHGYTIGATGCVGARGDVGLTGPMQYKTPHYVLSQLQCIDIGDNVIISHYYVINVKKKLKHHVVIPTSRIKTSYYLPSTVDGSTYHNCEADMLDAISVYRKHIVKWLYLYQWIVIENQLGCRDIFNCVIQYYPKLMSS